MSKVIVPKAHSTHFHLPHSAGSAKQYSITFFKRKFLEEIFQKVQYKLCHYFNSLKKEKVYQTFPFYAVPKLKLHNARTL
jgi:hypothetical protein